MLQQLFRNIPDVTKNLLIINVLMFLATFLLEANDIYLRREFAMFYFDNPLFEPFQVVTHFFMHGGFGHIFFNMFALVMFGSQLEKAWGPKRFLLFYFITALGAAALHTGVNMLIVNDLVGTVSPFHDGIIVDDHLLWQELSKGQMDKLAAALYSPVLGASGAVYGLLLAFALLWPNTELMLIFLPIPIKAKYFVPVLMIGELYLGVNDFEWDNIAHFAHLGGALIGFILVMIWKRDRTKFY